MVPWGRKKERYSDDKVPSVIMFFVPTKRISWSLLMEEQLNYGIFFWGSACDMLKRADMKLYLQYDYNSYNNNKKKILYLGGEMKKYSSVEGLGLGGRETGLPFFLFIFERESTSRAGEGDRETKGARIHKP